MFAQLLKFLAFITNFPSHDQFWKEHPLIIFRFSSSLEMGDYK